MVVLSSQQMVELKPVIMATCAYFALFYVFMCFQSFSKFYLFFQQKKAENSNEKGSSLK